MYSSLRALLQFCCLSAPHYSNGIWCCNTDDMAILWSNASSLRTALFLSRFLALNVLFLPKKQNSFLGHWWSVIVRLMLNCSIQLISGHWTICRGCVVWMHRMWQNNKTTITEMTIQVQSRFFVLPFWLPWQHTHKLYFSRFAYSFPQHFSSWWKLVGASSTSIRLEIQNKYSCYWSV